MSSSSPSSACSSASTGSYLTLLILNLEKERKSAPEPAPTTDRRLSTTAKSGATTGSPSFLQIECQTVGTSLLRPTAVPRVNSSFNNTDAS